MVRTNAVPKGTTNTIYAAHGQPGQAQAMLGLLEETRQRLREASLALANSGREG